MWRYTGYDGCFCVTAKTTWVAFQIYEMAIDEILYPNLWHHFGTYNRWNHSERCKDFRHVSEFNWWKDLGGNGCPVRGFPVNEGATGGSSETPGGVPVLQYEVL